MSRPLHLRLAFVSVLAAGAVALFLRPDRDSRVRSASDSAAPRAGTAVALSEPAGAAGGPAATASRRAVEGWAEAAPAAFSLTYAQAWHGPLPPAMAAFRDWTIEYAGAESYLDQALLELEGVALALARRAEMAALIESDPEMALALTVPAVVREVLPPAIEELLEDRVSGRGDYEILMAVQPLGSRRPEERFVKATVGGRTYDAFVYGRRRGQLSQEGASLHGIALDGRMAVHESPVRVLEPGESVPDGLAAGRCPASGAAVAAVAPFAPVNLRGATVVEVDGELWQLASSDLLDALEFKLVAAEDQAGPVVPRVMAGESVLPLPPTSWTTGNKNLLVIRVDFSDRAGEPATYQAALDLMNNSVGPYYDAASYGATSLTTTVTAATYRMPQTAEAYATGNLSSQLYTDATAAASADYTIANYQHVMILFARLNSISGSQFTWAGLGSVGGGRTWINGYYDFRVTSHELGHNYGLYHANLWQVSDGNPASPNGSSTEYADPFDAMGGGSTNANHHFNPWFKNRLGWLPDAAVRPVTTSGTYRLTRFDHRNTPLNQDLALNVFCDGRRTTWIGFRQNLTSNASVFNGAYVLWGFGNNTQSQLLDMTTPGSGASDAGLQIGTTFTDAARGISIRPLARGGSSPAEYLDVEITLGQPASPFAVGWGSSQAVSSLPATATGVRGVAAGSQHGLALRTDGTVLAWGTGTSGQTTVPAGLSGVAAVSARGNVSGALRGDGTVALWGDATYGQTTVPAGLSGVTGLSVGGDHVLAVKSDGTVVAWGDNSHGETSVPAGLTSVAAVAAGSNTSYALRSNGTVTRWGAAQGTIPAGLSSVVALAAGNAHALALRGDGTVVAWGDNGYGQSTVPAGLTGVTAIAAGSYHSLALKADGTLVQWGYSGSNSALPVAISRVSAVAACDYASLAVIGTAPAAAAPVINAQPASTAGVAGGAITLSVGATGSGTLTYQWRLNGVDIAGATGSSYTIPSAQSFHAGTYTVVVTVGGASATSAGATVTVNPAPASNARVMNLSTRGLALTGTDVLIPGFVLEGSGTKRLLVRAVGPTLTGLGVSGALADPQFVLKRFDTTANAYVDVLANDNWGTNANAAQIATTAATVGAFALAGGSADSAVLTDLAPGRYTVVAGGKGAATGVAMVELYDADAGAPTVRMVNISNRGFVGAGSNIMIPGFVVSNEGSRTFLVRAVGPTLAGLGVSGTLADPQLAIYSGNTRILGNDDWGAASGAATTASVAAQVGAFALNAGSKDAAFVVTLAPGAYTVQASGVGDTTGVALVEIYLVP